MGTDQHGRGLRDGHADVNRTREDVGVAGEGHHVEGEYRAEQFEAVFGIKVSEALDFVIEKFELVGRGRVHRITQHEAEDLVNETMIRALKYCAGPNEPVRSAHGLLSRMAFLELKTFLKRRQQRYLDLIDKVIDDARSRPTASAFTVPGDIGPDYEESIESLIAAIPNPRERLIMTLLWDPDKGTFDAMTQIEVAEIVYGPFDRPDLTSTGVVKERNKARFRVRRVLQGWFKKWAQTQHELRISLQERVRVRDAKW